MLPPEPTRSGRRFAAAVLISLVLHTGLVIALNAFTHRSPSRAGGSGAGLDTRVSYVETIVCLSDPPPRRAPATPPLPRIQAPATVTPPPAAALVATAPAAPASSPESPRFAATGPAVPGESAGGDGTAAGATFFEVHAQAKSVVYVIDCSMSMGQDHALERAREELLASLNRLSPSTRFQVIAYNWNPEPLRLNGRTDLAAATPENKFQAEEQIRKLQARGRTAHVPALQYALRLQPDVIFFLTDADDLKAQEVRQVTQANHGRTVIHAIELNSSGRGSAPGALSALAHHNRGDYRIVR
jgi:von Willebrand factor type A domain